MLLSEVFGKNLIKLDLKSSTKDECFKELTDAIAQTHRNLSKEELYGALIEREKKINTSVMSGVAVPHGVCAALQNAVGAFGYSKQGIEYEANDNKPVHFVFMFFTGSASSGEAHLQILSAIIRFLKSGALSYIKNASGAEEVQKLLEGFK